MRPSCLSILLLLLLLILLANPSLFGQPTGTMPPLRVTVEKEGMHSLGTTDLAPFCDPGTIEADRLVMTRDGREIPIEVRGRAGGRLGPGDQIIFFADAFQSPQTGRGVFVLKLGKNPTPLRFGRGPDGLDPTAATEADRVVREERNEVFEPFPCVQGAFLKSGPPAFRYAWKRLLAPPANAGDVLPDECLATFVLDVQPEPRQAIAATLFLDIVGPPVDLVPQKLMVNFNGKDLPAATWESPLARRLEFRIPPNTLLKSNTIQVRNLSPVARFEEADNEVHRTRRNFVLVDRVILATPTLLYGPPEPSRQVIYRLSGRAGTKLAFPTLNSDGFRLFDATKGLYCPGRTLTLGNEPETVACAVGPTGYFHPTVELLRPTETHLPGPGAEWVCITTTRLEATLAPLVKHRGASGMSTLVVEARELYDTFTHGRFDPAAFRLFLRAAQKNWKTKPRYVLLVGDADHDADWPSTKETLPTELVMTAYNGVTASDGRIADLDSDGLPDLAIGRLPARDPDALRGMIERIIALETTPEPGLWRRHLRFVAGEARFGDTVDALLEKTFRGVLAKEIPPAYRISLTYASPKSPYFWPAKGFGDQVRLQLDEGCLGFTYLGHGLPDRLDNVRVGERRYPILDAKAAATVDSGRRNPLLTLLACWTGEFDNPVRDCLAEVLMARPNGPAAIIAATRISHPYPNALLGIGLARAVFGEKDRVGDIFRAAMATMTSESKGAFGLLARPFLSKATPADELVRDHYALYHLFGDPALVLPRPPGTLKLEPGTARRGEALQVVVAVEAPEPGKLCLSLDRPLGVLDARVPGEVQAENENEASIIERHRLANEPAVAESSVDLEQARQTVFLQLPAELPAGAYLLRGYLTRPSGRDALGAVSITIE